MNIIKGQIHKILDVGYFGQNNTPKQIIIVRIDEKFNNEVPVEFVGEDNILMLTGYKEGDVIEISVCLGGREWKGKWYPSITAKEVTSVKSETIHSPLYSPPTEPEKDLPF